MNPNRLTRRRILGSTLGAGIAGLAGCSSAGSREDPQVGTPSREVRSEHNDQPGHGDTAHGHDQATEPQSSAEVAVNTARGGGSTEYHFDPHVTWVEVGATVTWRLESGSHTATAYHPGNDQPRLVPEDTSAWDSGVLSEQGATFEHTFDTAGVYHYLCEPHERFGMIATVIVGTPDLERQAALQEPPSDKPEEVRRKLAELNGMVREMVGAGHQDDEDGHYGDETATDAGHHNEDGHHGDSTETEVGHHDEQPDHHGEETATEPGHHDEADGHHGNDTTTESRHHTGA